jgi:hypothetical protein
VRAVELDWWMKKDRSRTVSKFEVMEPSLSSFYLSLFVFMGVVFLVASRPNITSMSVDNHYERFASAKAGRNVEETVTAEGFLEYMTKDLPVRAELIFVLYDGLNLEKYYELNSREVSPALKPPKGPFRRKYTVHTYYVNLYKNSIEIYREFETNMTGKGRQSDVIMHREATSYIQVVGPKLTPLL